MTLIISLLFIPEVLGGLRVGGEGGVCERSLCGSAVGLGCGAGAVERRELLSLGPSGKTTSAAFCAAQRPRTSGSWHERAKRFVCQLLAEKRRWRRSAGGGLNFTANFRFHLVSSARALDANIAKL